MVDSIFYQYSDDCQKTNILAEMSLNEDVPTTGMLLIRVRQDLKGGTGIILHVRAVQIFRY